jgi:hypothetical protein
MPNIGFCVIWAEAIHISFGLILGSSSGSSFLIELFVLILSSVFQLGSGSGRSFSNSQSTQSALAVIRYIMIKFTHFVKV